MTTIPSTIKFGDDVRYTDSKGNAKLAKVLADKSSISPDTNLPGLSENQFHILVLSPSGRMYNKFSIPDALTLENPDEYKDDEGNLIGVIRAL